jgi:glycosyltransferase involved in cell wall biosynthesis
MADYLAASYEMPRDQVEVIPIGSDPDHIVPMSKASRFRAAHGLSGFLALYAGNFGRHQNFDTLLDAARLLRDAGKEIRFLFVGDGARREHICRRISQESITNARVLPFVAPEDLPDLLASADVSLVTLEPGAEGLGVPSKLYNSMASGRPVVAIVAPGSEVARVLAEEECGVRVDQGDACRLAEALAALADRPDDTLRMGANARRAALEKYATRHVTAQFYRLFTAVAAAHRSPEPGRVVPRRKLGSSMVRCSDTAARLREGETRI